SQLAGYRRLAEDAESRLGWRIITRCFELDERDERVRGALEARDDPAPALPDEYRESHLEIAELVRRLRDGEKLAEEEEPRLEAAVGIGMTEIRESLAIADDDEAPPPDEDDGEIDEEAPTIQFTSLVGSKGLSASYVFI